MGTECVSRVGQGRWRHQFTCWLGIFVYASFLIVAGDMGEKVAEQKNSLTWVGHFDPAMNYLSARALLQFDQSSPERRIWLADGLRLDSVRGAASPLVGSNRDAGQYLFHGEGVNELELSYSGRLPSVPDPLSVFVDPVPQSTQVHLDRFIYLSCVRDFYPNAGMDFGNIQLNITVPNDWNCLGSGIQRRVEPGSKQTHYEFDNAGGKGMSLVFGHFVPIGSLQAAIPVRLHGRSYFNSNWYFPNTDIVRILAFYHERFGPLDLPELNILFQYGRRFGGVSYSGLVILEVDSAWSSFSVQTRKNIRSDSPLSIFDAKIDVLSHELAHQWWGGLVSWKTPHENWITEGLATYSSLISLRAWRGEKTFRRALARLRGQVKRHAQVGSPVGGSGFALLHRDRKAYQAVVYGKPALMLCALADRIGEMELCARLRSILRDRRRCNLDTADFLQRLAAGDKALLLWMQTWIFERGLPE